MKTLSAFVGCIGLTVALTGPTFAQQVAATNADTTTSTMTQPSSETAPNGSLKRYHDMFRASKLVGTNVYNQDGQTIGSVDDLLVGQDGKISEAVLSVGGFLGIGGKLVAVPFDQFKFVESRRSSSENGVMSTGSTTTTTTATGTTPATTRMSGNSSASSEAIDYSLVLPSATKNSLTSAAGFKYEG